MLIGTRPSIQHIGSPGKSSLLCLWLSAPLLSCLVLSCIVPATQVSTFHKADALAHRTMGREVQADIWGLTRPPGRKKKWNHAWSLMCLLPTLNTIKRIYCSYWHKAVLIANNMLVYWLQQKYSSLKKTLKMLSNPWQYNNQELFYSCEELRTNCKGYALTLQHLSVRRSSKWGLSDKPRCPHKGTVSDSSLKGLELFPIWRKNILSKFKVIGIVQTVAYTIEKQAVVL